MFPLGFRGGKVERRENPRIEDIPAVTALRGGEGNVAACDLHRLHRSGRFLDAMVTKIHENRFVLLDQNRPVFWNLKSLEAFQNGTSNRSLVQERSLLLHCHPRGNPTCRSIQRITSAGLAQSISTNRCFSAGIPGVSSLCTISICDCERFRKWLFSSVSEFCRT